MSPGGGRVRWGADPAPTRRTMLVDGLEASVVDLADPAYLEIPYVRRIAAILDAVGPPDVLHLGGGACTLPRWLAATRPAARPCARSSTRSTTRSSASRAPSWAWTRCPGVRVRVGDARAGVAAQRPRSFDAVVADVFVGPYVPAHVMTEQALADVRRVLRPGGVYVANLIDEAPLRRVRRQLATIAGALGEPTLIAERAVLRGRRAGNFVVAAGRTLPLARLRRDAGRRRHPRRRGGRPVV